MGASYQVLVARRTLVVGLNCEILQVVAVEMQVDSTFEHIFPIDGQGVRRVLVPFGTGAEGVEMFWFVSSGKDSRSREKQAHRNLCAGPVSGRYPRRGILKIS